MIEPEPDAMTIELDESVCRVTIHCDVDPSVYRLLELVPSDYCKVGEPIEIDFGEFEIEGAELVAQMTSWIRMESANRRIVLRHAPQLLAHTLYRVGSLQGSDGTICLIDPRTEEPYAG